VGDAGDQTSTGQGPPVNGLLNHADLYALYVMIKAVKNDLMWGQNTGAQADDISSGKISLMYWPLIRLEGPKGFSRTIVDVFQSFFITLKYFTVILLPQHNE